MKTAELVMGDGLLMSWNARFNLYLCEREGTPWFWIDRDRALCITQILETMRLMRDQGRAFHTDAPLVILDDQEWSFSIQARESERPTGGFVQIGEPVALTLKGVTSDLGWLVEFINPFHVTSRGEGRCGT